MPPHCLQPLRAGGLGAPRRLCAAQRVGWGSARRRFLSQTPDLHGPFPCSERFRGLEDNWLRVMFGESLGIFKDGIQKKCLEVQLIF